MSMFSLVIVDDEPWALRGIQNACDYAQLGFDISMATTDPNEALTYVLEKRPDAVITDIYMNYVSGIDLMRRARKEKCAAQFIVVSGYSEFEYARDALRCGAFAYLLKPIDKDEFYEVMWELSRHMRARRNISEDAPVKGNPTVRRMQRYLEENYSLDISLSGISEQFFLSPTYVCDLFKNETGQSITAFLREVRLNHAAEMLRAGQDSVSEIALKVGYADISYFGKLFRDMFHATPREYRRSARGAR